MIPELSTVKLGQLLFFFLLAPVPFTFPPPSCLNNHLTLKAFEFVSRSSSLSFSLSLRSVDVDIDVEVEVCYMHDSNCIDFFPPPPNQLQLRNTFFFSFLTVQLACLQVE